MSEANNPLNRYYNRVHSLLTRIPENLRSIDISRLRFQRNPSSGDTSATESSVRPIRTVSDQSAESQRTSRRESSTSLFGSANSSQTASPVHCSVNGTNGQPLCRPPHSHLYRHSSHYPLLFGSHNNWSSFGDHRLLSHLSSSPITQGDKERNVLSAIMSIIVIATLATALAQPKWFSITGGVCSRRYIGLQEFFYVGNFNNYHFSANKVKNGNTFDVKHRDFETKEMKSHLTTEDILLYGMNGELKNCVTPEIVTLQRTIIGLCFFAIMFNLIQFFFDTLGVHTKWLNAVRSHALGNILSVLLCVVIVGVSYLVSDLLEKEQRRLMKQTIDKTSNPESHHVEVKFELSYYLVTFSGLLAIIAAAANLLRRPHYYYIDASDAFWTDDIDEDLTSSTTGSPNWQSLTTSRSPLFIPPPPPPSISLPPPPPYTP